MSKNENPHAEADPFKRLFQAGGAGMGVMVWPGKDGAGFDVIDPDAPVPAGQPQKTRAGLKNIDPRAHDYFDFDI